MILDNNFPPDIRVEKEARSLINADHKIYLLCLKDKNQPFEELINNISIRRISIAQKWFIRKMNSLIFFTKFYHRGWAKEIEKLILEKRIESLHVHDLPLVKTALIIGKKYNIPVVADFHENYPACIRIYNYKTPLWKRIYLNNPKRWQKLEKECSEKVNKIIVVVEEAKQRIINDYNINSDKITVVSNTIDVDYFNSIPLDRKLIEKYKNNFIISYVGGFGPHRGIDTAIKSMNSVIKKIPNAKLLLIGGKVNEENLRKLTKNLELEKNIEFTGWQPSEKLPTYIFLSNICLVPHHKNPHTDNTIPHKLFQYMFMKKPVIVSDCKPLKRIINETKAGLIFQAGNPKNLAEKIIQIYKNPNQYGKKGHMAILTKYNWESEGKKLIKLYERIKNSN